MEKYTYYGLIYYNSFSPLEHVPKFENYIKIQDFIHKGIIFQRLVLKCPKLSEEWLNCQITSNNHTSSETKKSNEPTEVFFNFDIFQKRSKGPPKHEPKKDINSKLKFQKRCPFFAGQNFIFFLSTKT